MLLVKAREAPCVWPLPLGSSLVPLGLKHVAHISQHRLRNAHYFHFKTADFTLQVKLSPCLTVETDMLVNSGDLQPFHPSCPASLWEPRYFRVGAWHLLAPRPFPCTPGYLEASVIPVRSLSSAKCVPAGSSWAPELLSGLPSLFLLSYSGHLGSV